MLCFFNYMAMRSSTTSATVNFCWFYYRIKPHIFISVTALLPSVTDHFSWIHPQEMTCFICYPFMLLYMHFNHWYFTSRKGILGFQEAEGDSWQSPQQDTAAPRHQSGITFPAFHCSRKAPAEQFRGDLSSLEKTLRANHNCLLDIAVAETWISMQSRRKSQDNK